MRRRASLIALVFAVVACGGGGSSAATTSPSATPAPVPGTAPVAEGSYESIDAMAKDVQSTFYLCNAPIKVHDPPVNEDALAEASCSGDVTFLIFEPVDVAANAADIQASADGPSTLLVGDNWIIDCSSDQAACERIQGGTGGELIVGTP